MQTLLPELRGAPSAVPLDRGSSEDGLSITREPVSALDQDVGAHEPPKEPRPDLTDSEFVLALPMSLSASEVVSRAAEQGLTISEPFVHKVRFDALAAPELESESPATAQGELTLEAVNPEQTSRHAAPGAAPNNKSVFIRSLPLDLHPDEVVARGKQLGLRFSARYVYDIRRNAKARSKRVVPVGPAAPKEPSTPTIRATAVRPKAMPTKSKPTPRNTMSKADFVRSLPPGVSFKRAAAQAKAAGLSLSAAHFYEIKREVDKRATALKLAARAASNSKPVQQPRPAGKAHTFEGLRIASDDEREQALINAVTALGVSRARAVIDVVETMERVTRRGG